MIMRRARWFLMSFPMLQFVEQQRVKLWYVDVRNCCYRWTGDTGVDADMIQIQCNQRVTEYRKISSLYISKRVDCWERNS